MENIGLLNLLIGLAQGQAVFSGIFIIAAFLLFEARCPLKLDSYSPPKEGVEWSVTFLNDCHFEEMVSRYLQKTFSSFMAGKRLLKDIYIYAHTFQRWQERYLQWYIF